ncbi:hypothetical protein ACTI_66580 [Actinoplanes sp. OR16]|uniref:MerR family DNA-binding transcriptional regulator n=1 Tax=Actinoplanes sp. OR16 TaxID=946334 RepID=UPI000F6F4FB6|nr:MerR family DNA-binding transcriptional regulator [Actinoplanes sp. OR16]BBH69973.1 hypothetical protein ACTI_66580 [Actinoplanes sp. OR16]
MTGLRSSQLAGAAGVNPQTLRYYERRGLLAEPERCDDLATCADQPCCPIPFATITRGVPDAGRS